MDSLLGGVEGVTVEEKAAAEEDEEGRRGRRRGGRRASQTQGAIRHVRRNPHLAPVRSLHLLLTERRRAGAMEHARVVLHLYARAVATRASRCA